MKEQLHNLSINPSDAAVDTPPPPGEPQELASGVVFDFSKTPIGIEYGLTPAAQAYLELAGTGVPPEIVVKEGVELGIISPEVAQACLEAIKNDPWLIDGAPGGNHVLRMGDGQFTRPLPEVCVPSQKDLRSLLTNLEIPVELAGNAAFIAAICFVFYRLLRGKVRWKKS